MALDIKKFGTLGDVRAFLQGRIVGSVNVFKTHSSLYLHGKTLIFATPADTCTFDSTPDGAQIPLTQAEIKAQIEAQVADVSVTFDNGRVSLHLTAGGPIVLDKDGTANAQLGFDTTTDTSAAVYAEPGGTPPALVQIVPEHGSNAYLVVVDNA